MTMQRGEERASQSVEDFLKAMYRLQREGGRVATNALADELAISAPAVTDMAQRLHDDGTVDYVKYRGMRLTPKGERVALLMLRRHRLIEAYLVQDLGYALHEVHDEAEALEHSVSDRFVEAISLKLGHPRFDPHGDPIPNLDGVMAERDLQPLTQLALHRPAVVRRFLMHEPALLQATQARGLTMGAALEVTARAPFEGTLEVKVAARPAQTLGYKMAAAILVEIVENLC